MRQFRKVHNITKNYILIHSGFSRKFIYILFFSLHWPTELREIPRFLFIHEYGWMWRKWKIPLNVLFLTLLDIFLLFPGVSWLRIS